MICGFLIRFKLIVGFVVFLELYIIVNVKLLIGNLIFISF